MKIHWSILTIVVMAVIILIMIFFPRSCGNRRVEDLGDLTPTQEAELQAGIVVLRGQNDSLRRELGKVATRDSVQRRAHIAAVDPPKKAIKRLEADPEVAQVRKDSPKTDSLLRAKDEVITRHETRIADMEQSAQVTKQINEQIHHNFEKRLADTERLLSEEELENQQLARENKKLRIGRTLRNIAIPVLTVAGFVFGVIAVD